MSKETCLGCRSSEVWHRYRYRDDELPLCCRCAPNCPFPDRRVIVVAGNFREFEWWCEAYGFHPRRPHVAYLDRPYRLRGQGPIEYLYTGTGLQRRDLADIFDCLRCMDRRDWNPGPKWEEDKD